MTFSFFVTLFTTALLFVGCAATAPRSEISAAENAPLVWYLHPPAYDALYLYGKRQGETMEEAKRHALAAFSYAVRRFDEALRRNPLF